MTARFRGRLVALVASAALVAASQAHAVVLVNPGFELGNNGLGADGPGAFGWSGFNDHFSDSSHAETGTKALKVFGPFFTGGGAGVVQGGFPALPGQTWSATSSIFSPSSDAINGSNFALTKIEFLDATNTVVGAFESPHFTVASGLDTWVPETATGVAPAGAGAAQIVLVHVQLYNPVTGGAGWLDNASLGIVPEPATAGLLGTALLGLVSWRRRRSS
jgi:hypothetical protein